MLRLSGIRPTGEMHIGHYFSVIKPALELDADILIAQYHAPKSTPSDTERMVQMLYRFGVNENYVHLQEDEFRPAIYFELALYRSCRRTGAHDAVHVRRRERRASADLSRTHGA